MTTARPLSLLLAAVLFGDPAATSLLAAEAAATPEQVLKTVDAYCDGGELDAAIAELTEANVDPATLRKILESGRTYESKEPGSTTIQITDKYEATTEAVVVVPRGYDPKKPAGIAFVLHGLGGDGSQVQGLFDGFADAEGLIVVCPTARPLPSCCPNPDSAMLQNLPQAKTTGWWSYWSGSFVFSLLRQLSREYNIDHDHVLLAGYSMGGFGTWNIGMRFPDRFCALVPMAGGISGREYFGSDDTEMRSLLVNLVGKPLYFLHGDADTTVPVSFDQKSDAALKSHGSKDHVFVEVPGGTHMLEVMPGSKLMNDVGRFLKGKRRESAPKALSHAVLNCDHGSCYWVRVEELDGTQGRVEAKLKGKGKIELATEGVARVTVRLNDQMAKSGKPVDIKLNGKSSKTKYEPSLKALLETWAESEDPALLYDAEIELTLK